MNNQPKISIITVTYNAESTIEDTILSVINQSYTNIEYIIIDGGSTDKTLEIIKKYSDNISYWISEPDKGIYDAMNKGINLSTGEWINFMNCGDTFYSNTTIMDVFNIANKDSDIIYGNTHLLYEFGNFIRLSSHPTPTNYMPFYHQSSFTRSSLLKNSLFNLNFKICADKKFFYDMYNYNKTFEYVNIIIANYEAENGLSSTNKVKLEKEIGTIEKKTSNLNWKIHFFIFKIKTRIKNLIKTILPKSIVTRMKRYNVIRYINQ